MFKSNRYVSSKKLVYLAFSCSLFLLSSLLAAQNSPKYNWAHIIGAKSAASYAYHVVLDSVGNVYVAGSFSDSADFDPSDSVYMLKGAQYEDIFVLKLDADGKFIWAKQFSGPKSDFVGGLIIDRMGNVLITGSFKDTVDFDPGPGVQLKDAGLQEDIFVCKLNSNGDFIWVKTMGGSTLGSAGAGIVTDELGSIYVTGGFYGTMDFDPGTGTNNLISNGRNDIFVLKLDSNGNHQWAYSFGSNDNDIGHSIDYRNNEVVVTGNFISTVDFNPGSGVYNLRARGLDDVFVSKFSDSGVFLWARAMGGGGTDNGRDIKIDKNNNIYTTGYYRSAFSDFDPDSSSTFYLPYSGSGTVVSRIFVSKLDSAGKFSWAKGMGSSNFCEGFAITLDEFDGVYIGGTFRRTVDFDPGPDTFFLTAQGSWDDIFIEKFDTQGNFVWAKAIGATSDEDHCWSLAALDSVTIYSAGSFGSKVDFDPGNDTQYLQALSSKSAYILKLGECLKPSVKQQPHIVRTCVGDSIAHSLNTVGTELTYQWFKNGNKIIGATSKVYSIPVFTASDTGFYVCKIIGLCDSIVSDTITTLLNLPVYGRDTVSKCDSFKWINGVTYYSSTDSAKAFMQNQNGCDSIVTLKLLIINNGSIDTVNACDSFKWVNNITYYANTDSAKHVIKNSFGCDSTLTLNLTILRSTSRIDSISACDSYKWKNGKTYTSSVRDSLKVSGGNSLGCDSFEVLHLTIKPEPNLLITRIGDSLQVAQTNAAYQWIDCENGDSLLQGETGRVYSPRIIGTFAVIVNLNNCFDTSSCFKIDDLTNINLLTKNTNGFAVFPNPNNGSFTIKTPSTWITGSINLFDNAGRFVQSISCAGNCDIQLKRIKSGVYFLLFESENLILGKEIIIIE